MVLSIKNTGPIINAEIDLSKKLTIITGLNNTGKTILAYLIFGVANRQNRIPRGFRFNYLNDRLGDLISNGSIDIDLCEFSEMELSALMDEYNRLLTRNIPSVLGNPLSFKEASISIFWKSFEQFLENFKRQRFSLGFGFGSKRQVTIRKQRDSPIIKVFLADTFDKEFVDEDQKKFILKILEDAMTNEFFKFLGDDVHFLSAERIGISVFGKDILLNRVNQLDDLVNLSKSNSDSSSFAQKINSYPLPIQDALRAQEELTKFKRNKSDFFELAQEIEQKICDAKVDINTDGDFDISLSGDKKINLNTSGSNIKSLSALIFFLKYQANKDSLLIFDEPEINLHPDKQIILARILCKMVNKGVRLILSTHSDYILRELNILFALGSSKKDVSVLQDKYQYANDEIINSECANFYFLDKNYLSDTQVSKIDFTNGEFIVPSIDKIINDQNVISEDIYYTIKDYENN